MQKLLHHLKADYAKFKKSPPWRLALWAAIVLLAVTYVLWLRFGPQPVKHGQVVAATTSPAVANMERKPVQPKKLMVLTPKAEAVKRLKLPPEQAANPKEEVFEATDAPASRYGTTTVTFANLSTGMPRTTVIAKEAPLFRFERGNTIGGEVGMGLHGRYFRADYQRDILSIKGVVLSGRASVTSYPNDTDAQIGVRGEWRW